MGGVGGVEVGVTFQESSCVCVCFCWITSEQTRLVYRVCYIWYCDDRELTMRLCADVGVFGWGWG